MPETFAEFHETLTLEIPKINSRLMEFSEARTSGKRGLVVEVAAIHAGLTGNYNHYSADELERSLNSWVAPYPKPIILNHDIQNAEPVGRVMAAKMDAEEDGSKFTRLQIAITDPAAIEKILDQRYLTGSVGGKSDEALCSICKTDWANASMSAGAPCKHTRGKTYKGSLAYLDRKSLLFKEYSFVNAPADGRSMILGDKAEATTQEADGWVKAARFFDLNMVKEEIVEYTESEARDVLEGMRAKESRPLYLNLKGAFLSALAVEESEAADDKENSTVAEQTEDVLAITDQLSDDLAKGAPAEETTETEPEEETPAQEDTEDGDGDEPVDGDGVPAAEGEPTGERDESDGEAGEDEEVASEEEENPDEVEEQNNLRVKRRPQSQEKARAKDWDSQFARPTVPSPLPNPTKGADKTRESDEEDEEISETVSGEGLEERLAEFERRVQELESRETALTEENARLKTALHRTLAERVVDQKIALGLGSLEERQELLEEHATRNASSLADTLRDLASMPLPSTVTDVSGMPGMESKLAAIGSADAKDKIMESEPVEEKIDPEQVLVDVLMGRRKF